MLCITSTGCLIDTLSRLRNFCLELPLLIAINSQERGITSALMTVTLRDHDTIFVQGSPDRVTVILMTRFDDPSDIVLGKVFLQVIIIIIICGALLIGGVQEFYDARRQNNLQNAPAVLFGKEPPKEVRDLISPAVDPKNPANYITFGMLPLFC